MLNENTSIITLKKFFSTFFNFWNKKVQKITGQAITSKKASTKIVNAFLMITVYKYNLNDI